MLRSSQCFVPDNKFADASITDLEVNKDFLFFSSILCKEDLIRIKYGIIYRGRIILQAGRIFAGIKFLKYLERAVNGDFVRLYCCYLTILFPLSLLS